MQIWNKITPKIPDRDRTDLFHNRWIELSQFALSTGSFILYLVSGILIIRSKKEFVKQNKYQIHILQQTIGKSSIFTLEYLGKISNFPIHGHTHTHAQVQATSDKNTFVWNSWKSFVVCSAYQCTSLPHRSPSRQITNNMSKTLQ